MNLFNLNDLFSFYPLNSIKITQFNTVFKKSNYNLKSRIDTTLNNDLRRLLVATESVYRFSNLRTIDKSRFHNLWNKHWQHKLFMWKYNHYDLYFSDLLDKQKLFYDYSDLYKLQIELGNQLIHNNITVKSIASFFNNKSKNLPNNFYTICIWRKAFNLSFPNTWFGLRGNLRNPQFPTTSQKFLLEYLHKSHIPLFVVVNNLYQIILSEPSDNVMLAKEMGHVLRHWYYDRFLWTNDLADIYHGWFFINPYDASEYANYIKYNYPRASAYHGIDIVSIKFSFYYRLNRLSPPRSQMRILPDLKEIGRLISQSDFRQDLVFHPKQKYGSSYFQGQPIYYLDPNKISNQKEPYKRFNQQFVNNYDRELDYPIFLSKDIASASWEKFIQTNLHFMRVKKPVWTTYNLEDFLKDYETDSRLNKANFLFVPSYDAKDGIYGIRAYEKMTHHTGDKHSVLMRLLLLYRIWSKRIIWALTSRKAPNW